MSATAARGAGLQLLPAGLLVLAAWTAPCPAGQNVGEVQVSREGLAAVRLALQYLAGQQRGDGTFAGQLGDTSGIVATVGLAWLATGSLPGEGAYGKQVARCVEYIVSNQQPTGLLFRGREEQQVMYHHALAALFLAEAWGQTLDKRIPDRLKKAVELIVRCQNERGGWRYQPRVADDDLSVSVMQLNALRAAQDAGVAVPKETIERAVRYIESCRPPADQEKGLYQGFSYQPGGPRTWSTTAAGLMSLMLCGQYKAGKLRDGLDYLVQVRQRGEDQRWFIYGHYYAAQAMYQAGSQGGKFLDYWQKWYPDISRTLVERQVRSGPDRGRIEVDREYGVWGTAMSVLILAVPYRYLPAYQR